ncbi:MAG: hypothetical protein NC337_09325 [Roseburia sp.]|nr:hypothetical protein [Roseburia sp.]
MFTVKKYLKLLSCDNEAELEKEIAKISYEDAKQFVKITVQFFQKTKVDLNNLDF